jgi:hypothetical protein
MFCRSLFVLFYLATVDDAAFEKLLYEKDAKMM